MNLKKFGGSVLAASLLATGLAVVAVPLAASAHVPTVNATCSTLTVNAEDYAAAVPATEGTPGTPGQPYIAPTPPTPGQPYIAPTPGTPAVPGTPEVPATYEQDFKFVFKGDGQHGGDKFEWHPIDWSSPGWEKTGEKRDGALLTPEIPATPGTPAVPGNPGQPYIAPTPGNPGQPFIPATPGTDGTPAKANHVTVYVNGATVEDTDFSTSFHGEFGFDGQQSSTYRVVITAWDDAKYNLDTGTVTVAPCEGAPVPVIKPVATISVDNCMYDRNGTPVDRPTVLTYDNTESTDAVAFKVTGFPQFDRTVPAGETATVAVPFDTFPSGTLEVTAGDQTFKLDVAECKVPTEKPAPIVEQTTKVTTDCKTDLTTTAVTTTTTNWYLNDELVWVKDVPVSVTTETSAKATDKDCPPAVVVPPVTTPPTTTPTPPVTVPTVPAAPVTVAAKSGAEQAPVAATDTSQQLAHTGSTIPDSVLWIAGIVLALGIVLLVVEGARRKRRTE